MPEVKRMHGSASCLFPAIPNSSQPELEPRDICFEWQRFTEIERFQLFFFPAYSKRRGCSWLHCLLRVQQEADKKKRWGESEKSYLQGMKKITNDDWWKPWASHKLSKNRISIGNQRSIQAKSSNRVNDSAGAYFTRLIESPSETARGEYKPGNGVQFATKISLPAFHDRIPTSCGSLPVCTLEVRNMYSTSYILPCKHFLLPTLCTSRCVLYYLAPSGIYQHSFMLTKNGLFSK